MPGTLEIAVLAFLAALNTMREPPRQLGLPMLLIGHGLSAVCHLSDVVAVMPHGRIVEISPTGTTMRAPSRPRTRTLLASVLPRPGQRSP